MIVRKISACQKQRIARGIVGADEYQENIFIGYDPHGVLRSRVKLKDPENQRL